MAAAAELAVSNICWPDGQEAQETAISTLSLLGVNAIDIAPGKAFPDMAIKGGPDAIDRDELVAFRRTLLAGGGRYAGPMRVAGFQAVTFGRKESIFSENSEEVEALTDHMKGIIRLAEFVGAQTIVYGSGGTRLTEGLTDEQVAERAAAFFMPLDEEARNANVVLGIEPVSTTWTNGKPVFGRTGADVVSFTRSLQKDYGASNVKFVPDSFAMHDGGDDIQGVVLSAEVNGVLAPHAQIAEPGMALHAEDGPISDAHDQLDIALRSNFSSHAADRLQHGGPLPTLAIEMFAPKDEANILLKGHELQLALSGVVWAARYNYSRTLRSTTVE